MCSGAPPAPSPSQGRQQSGGAIQLRKGGTSHHAYAQQTLAHLSVDGHGPVFYQGQLYVLDKTTALWRVFERQELLRTVAELNDGRHNCTKYLDYVGISEQATSIAGDPTFFEHAAIGIACAGNFYHADAAELHIEELKAHHRQRVMLGFKPVPTSTPLFDAFLHQTFRSNTEGEEEQQRNLVQEIAGAILLGIMARFQKAVLFSDPYGRAGKGTLEKILTGLVPSEFVSAVSPFRWSEEYYLAGLAGSRLNVVGELPDSGSLPSADFKSVLGGDLLAGRQPTKSVVYFRNEAAHLFTSNHLIATRDQSEAFYSRWILIEFPNSLLLSGGSIDTALAERIIGQELPGIAHWALQGGLRLLKQGAFSTSKVHDRLMTKWRRSSNSIDEFIYECCDMGADLHERRSGFYAAYRAWCNESGRKPYARPKVKDLMEHRVGLAVRFAVLDGYDIIRGLAVKEAFVDRHTSL